MQKMGVAISTLLALFSQVATPSPPPNAPTWPGPRGGAHAMAYDERRRRSWQRLRKQDDRCGRLWKTALWFSKRRWAGLFPSTAAAASTSFTDSRMT